MGLGMRRKGTHLHQKEQLGEEPGVWGAGKAVWSPGHGQDGPGRSWSWRSVRLWSVCTPALRLGFAGLGRSWEVSRCSYRCLQPCRDSELRWCSENSWGNVKIRKGSQDGIWRRSSGQCLMIRASAPAPQSRFIPGQGHAPVGACLEDNQSVYLCHIDASLSFSPFLPLTPSLHSFPLIPPFHSIKKKIISGLKTNVLKKNGEETGVIRWWV